MQRLNIKLRQMLIEISTSQILICFFHVLTEKYVVWFLWHLCKPTELQMREAFAPQSLMCHILLKQHEDSQRVGEEISENIELLLQIRVLE